MAMQSKKEGFKIPDRYFEGFSQDIQKRLTHPLGNPGAAESCFKVPDAYFDRFESRMLKRLHTQPPEVRPLWNRSKFKWGVAIAAGMALMLLLQTGKDTSQPQFEDLARNEIEDYLEIRYSDLNTFELAESLPLEDLTMGDLLEDIPHDAQILNYLERKYEAYDHFNLENDE
jgi:hypothetical protein